MVTIDELLLEYSSVTYVRNAVIYCVKCLHEELDYTKEQTSPLSYDFNKPISVTKLENYLPLLKDLAESLNKLSNLTQIIRLQLEAKENSKTKEIQEKQSQTQNSLNEDRKKLENSQARINQEEGQLKVIREELSHKEAVFGGNFLHNVESLFSPFHGPTELINLKYDKIELSKKIENIEKLESEDIASKNELAGVIQQEEENTKDLSNQLTQLTANQSIYFGLMTDINSLIKYLLDASTKLNACRKGLTEYFQAYAMREDETIELPEEKKRKTALCLYFVETGSTILDGGVKPNNVILSAYRALLFLNNFDYFQNQYIQKKLSYAAYLEGTKEQFLTQLSSLTENISINSLIVDNISYKNFARSMEEIIDDSKNRFLRT